MMRALVADEGGAHARRAEVEIAAVAAIVPPWKPGDRSACWRSSRWRPLAAAARPLPASAPRSAATRPRGQVAMSGSAPGGASAARWERRQWRPSPTAAHRRRARPVRRGHVHRQRQPADGPEHDRRQRHVLGRAGRRRLHGRRLRLRPEHARDRRRRAQIELSSPPSAAGDPAARIRFQDASNVTAAELNVDIGLPAATPGTYTQDVSCGSHRARLSTSPLPIPVVCATDAERR